MSAPVSKKQCFGLGCPPAPVPLVPVPFCDSAGNVLRSYDVIPTLALLRIQNFLRRTRDLRKLQTLRLKKGLRLMWLKRETHPVVNLEVEEIDLTQDDTMEEVQAATDEEVEDFAKSVNDLFKTSDDETDDDPGFPPCLSEEQEAAVYEENYNAVAKNNEKQRLRDEGWEGDL